MSAETVGTLAAIVIFASFVLRGEMKIRLVNLLGSALFVWYGYLIGNYVLLFMGVAIVLVHLYQFWYRIKESHSARQMAKVEKRAATAEAKVDEQQQRIKSLIEERDKVQGVARDAAVSRPDRLLD